MFWNGVAKDHKDLMNIVRQALSGYGEITLPVTYVGTGDGGIDHFASPPPGVSEVWTLICTTGGGAGVGIFSVTGSVSGAQAAATVGVFYNIPEVEFLINDGAANYVVSDQYDVTVTQNALIVLGQEWAVNRWCPPVNDVEDSVLDLPNRAIDGNASIYTFRIEETTCIFHVRFDDATELDQYQIRARTATFNVTEAPQDWTFEYSDDGVNWFVADTVAGAVFFASELKTFNIGSNGRHFYWRLNVTSNAGGTDIEFSQILGRVTGTTVDCFTEEALILEGQGISGTDNIHISMKVKENIDTPYFNWELQGATAFDSALIFELQPGANPMKPRYVSNDNTMEYWIFATGRYVHVNTKVSTDSTSFMMGLLLPYSQPAEYSYPLFIAGGSPADTNRHFTDVTGLHRMCFDPPDNGSYIRDPGGEWRYVENRSSNESPLTTRVVWPYSGNVTAVSATWMTKISDGFDGSYMLIPLIVLDMDRESAPVVDHASNMYGEIQDVFQVSGSNNSTENIITIGGDQYICFQNVFRTTFRDFYAVKITP